MGISAVVLVSAVFSQAAGTQKDVQRHDHGHELLRKAAGDARSSLVDASGHLQNEQKSGANSSVSVSASKVKSGTHTATFEEYDHDKSGTLDPSEAAPFLTDQGFASSDWPMLLHNGGGVITSHGFQRLHRDMAMFDTADADKTGFLEPPEVETILKSAGLSSETFPWQHWDHDGDHRLSKAEFLAAGPAVAHAVNQNANALLQADIDHDDLKFPQREYVGKDLDDTD
eukprot:gnl/MRDRNA2_/MRDRNA2_124100_c0_seq1.p1 gnl/MRDRNA2_/MRDRNA2_124100_c0~~gnl/MRDRNA2_/MRDRNA2_124100_c0_seq1.p1  ORF type:complete len:228 (-),score=49.30 gnl/MRDRNA2_/MRDRNA2_124100_c0_seq1:12-695(-)